LSWKDDRRNTRSTRPDNGDAKGVLRQQLDRYVQLGVPKLAGLLEPNFRALAADLIARHDRVPAGAGGAEARIALLLVIRSSLVAPEKLMPLVSVRGKAGYVDMTPSMPETFVTIEGIDIPSRPVYVVHDFDAGDHFRNQAPSAAAKLIGDAGRQPVTIDEGVSAAVLNPELLRDGHAYSILASRSTDKGLAKSVPALWVSRGAPRLGWCWNENPHSWLGSASCLARSGT
jgi:hypothetical protein